MKFEKIHNPKNDNNAVDRKWPEERSGHCMCADDNFLYLFGGYNPNDSHAIYTKLWRFNTTTQKWVVLPDHENQAPTTGASISMVHWNRKLITFGGTGYPFAQGNSNLISMYCLRTYKWYDLTKMALDYAIARGRDENEIKVRQCGCTSIRNAPPRSKYGQAMSVSPAGKVYIFAGTIGREFENDLHSFCLKDLHWTQHNFCFEHRQPIPEPRYRQGVVYKENKFIVLGGATSNWIFGFDKIHQFDFTKKTWKIIKPNVTKDDDGGDAVLYPSARHSHICVQDGGKVYLIGGVPVVDKSLDDIWVLDLDNLQWKQMEETFPYAVCFHAAAVCDHQIFVFGGTNTSQKRVNDLHKTQLADTVKSLRRQSWLHVSKRLQDNNCLNKETLCELGIPKCFNEWLDDPIMLAA